MGRARIMARFRAARGRAFFRFARGAGAGAYKAPSMKRRMAAAVSKNC